MSGHPLIFPLNINYFVRGYVLFAGEIDRAKLGAVVFADIEKRRAINKITHPLIYSEIRYQVFKYLLKGSVWKFIFCHRYCINGIYVLLNSSFCWFFYSGILKSLLYHDILKSEWLFIFKLPIYWSARCFEACFFFK